MLSGRGQLFSAAQNDLNKAMLMTRGQYKDRHYYEKLKVKIHLKYEEIAVLTLSMCEKIQTNFTRWQKRYS